MSFFKLTFKSSRRINETKRWWKHVGQQPRRTGLHSPSDDIVRGTSAGGGLPPVGNCGPHSYTARNDGDDRTMALYTLYQLSNL